MNSISIWAKQTLIIGLNILLSLGTLKAANYYVDPATGNISNDGSSGTPWSTLEAVFTAGKTFQPGDTIFLLDGYHGYPTIEGYNNDYVTIVPKSGETPDIKKLIVQNASRWLISGLNVSPEYVGSYERGNFIDLKSTADSITIENCYIFSTEDVTGWTSSDFTGKFGDGISVNSSNSSITNNYILNTRYAMAVTYTATNTVVGYNTMKGILGDGIRGLGNNCLYEYNTVKAFYGVNDHHDDGFQSWSGGHDGIPSGGDTVKNVTLRGNMFIDRIEQNVLFPPSANDGYGMQGIGCFDGFFENFRIENNLIVTDMWHGIAILGALNCTIINNTVITNPINETAKTPWITIEAHKDGREGSGCLIRNNIVSALRLTVGSTVDNNIIAVNYAAQFADYEGQDFHLKALSSAVNTGESEFAPTLDLDKNTRTLPYDIGCYEFVNNSSDVTAPSAPTNVDTIEVQLTGATLIWNAATDDKGILGYRIYKGGKEPVVTQDTTITVSGLSPLTTYTFTVTAVDSAGNESVPSTEIEITTPEKGTVYSTNAWQNLTLSEQTGIFTVTFDVIPLSADGGMDAVIGILNGTADNYSDLACITRFYGNAIDARDGGSYTSESTINYTLYQAYHFRMIIDVPNHEYNVFVTPQGDKEKMLAKEFAFRTDQNSVTSLNAWALVHINGLIQVSDLIFTPGGTIDKENPSTPTGITASNITATSALLSWNASTDNDTIANYQIYAISNTDTVITSTSNADLSKTVTGLTPETEYSFKISALDPSLNESDMSASVTGTTLTTAIISSTLEKAKIYPNPLTSDNLNIELNGYKSNLLQITISDITGKAVYSELKNITANSISIPLKNLNSGIYILQLKGNNFVKTQKLIVE